MKPILVNLEPSDYSEMAKNQLCEFFEYRELCPNLPIQDQIVNASAIITRLGYRINEHLVGRAKQLKYVATATTGTNHLDEAFLQSRRVLVVSLKGELDFLDQITPTAEHTWGLLLALCRNYKPAFKDVEDKNWRRDLFLGRQLYGKIIGIVGLGRLGMMVANYAKAFGMRVIYSDTKKKVESFEQVALNELMRLSDVVSVHLPLNETTEKLIDFNCLSSLKDGALLINTARGEVIDESALLWALKSGKLAGAALDVLSQETIWHGQIPEEHKLLEYANSHPNLIITPHIGGACPDAMRLTEEFVAKKLLVNVMKIA